MPDLSFDLDIRDVERDVIVDPVVFVRLTRSDEPAGNAWRFAMDGAVRARTLDHAPAGSPLILRLSPSRYRDIGRVASVRDDRLIPDLDGNLLIAPRSPAEWRPSFVPWAQLTTTFDALKRLLLQSKAFQLGRDANGGVLDEDAYNAVDPEDESPSLAKMSLLNLYSRLSTETPPDVDEPWLSRVSELLQGSRERFIGKVDERCLQIVTALDKKGKGGYGHAGASLHKKNFESIPGVTEVTNLVSVKTTEKKANLQFTVCRARFENGESVCLLDADIDENGRLLAHSFDLIRHLGTQGTHPLDVHESLRMKFPANSLGYRLAPRQPIPEVRVRVASDAER